jgi:hemolysin activation/secretion protein
LSNDTTDVSLDLGFDYKDVYNFLLYEESNRDRLRVGRLGLKIDHSDVLGRTIINNEIDNGFPNQWGSLQAKDSRASRDGSGGKFTKDVIDVLRLQRMPVESTLLLKGQAQFASHVLTSTEQYQLGGIANLRGYTNGEAVGDNGMATTAELSFPVYFIPKNIKAPLSKSSLYDAVRLAGFYDWGAVSLRKAAVGEQKTRSLKDVGFGIRYDLPESFSIRYDVAWPLYERASDNAGVHQWLKVSKDF